LPIGKRKEERMIELFDNSIATEIPSWKIATIPILVSQATKGKVRYILDYKNRHISLNGYLLIYRLKFYISFFF